MTTTPAAPEIHRFSAAELHKRTQRLGGVELLVEGVAELLPGVRFDKPETIPPPVAAIMRALRKRTAFAVTIEAEGLAWRVEITQ